MVFSVELAEATGLAWSCVRAVADVVEVDSYVISIDAVFDGMLWTSIDGAWWPLSWELPWEWMLAALGEFAEAEADSRVMVNCPEAGYWTWSNSVVLNVLWHDASDLDGGCFAWSSASYEVVYLSYAAPFAAGRGFLGPGGVRRLGGWSSSGMFLGMFVLD